MEKGNTFNGVSNGRNQSALVGKYIGILYHLGYFQEVVDD